MFHSSYTITNSCNWTTTVTVANGSLSYDDRPIVENCTLFNLHPANSFIRTRHRFHIVTVNIHCDDLSHAHMFSNIIYAYLYIILINIPHRPNIAFSKLPVCKNKEIIRNIDTLYIQLYMLFMTQMCKISDCRWKLIVINLLSLVQVTYRWK